MIVAITGHQGLAPAIGRVVRRELHDALSASGAHLSVLSALAQGPDQWAARSALSLGGRLIAVVPSRDYRDTFHGEGRAGYDQLLQRAAEVVELDNDRSDEQAFMAAGRYVVDRCDRLLAVWDGQPAAGLGGTGDVVGYAQERKVPVTIIWPNGARR